MSIQLILSKRDLCITGRKSPSLGAYGIIPAKFERHGIYLLMNKDLKPALFYKNGGVLSLTGPALNKLLRAVLDKGIPFRFRAKGFSMAPFIRDGDIVTVSPLSGSSPGLGDVVAFIHPETKRLIIHRVVGKSLKSYKIKGDNISQGDGPITKEHIMGLVTKVERDGRKVFFGLGPEKFLISFMTGSGFLQRLLPVMWRRVRPIFR